MAISSRLEGLGSNAEILVYLRFSDPMNRGGLLFADRTCHTRTLAVCHLLPTCNLDRSGQVSLYRPKDQQHEELS
jgi:hypothetical protein